MCRPREPDVFGTPGSPSRSSSSLTQRATSSTCVEARAVARIEIDRHVVRRAADRLHAREPRVLRDRRELRHVEQRRQRSADQPIARPLLVDRLDVRRAAPRAARPAAALPDAAAGRTPACRRRSETASSRAADRRPPAGCSGDTVDVVAQQVALRDPQLRPEHLREIGDARACRRSAAATSPSFRASSSSCSCSTTCVRGSFGRTRCSPDRRTSSLARGLCSSGTSELSTSGCSALSHPRAAPPRAFLSSRSRDTPAVAAVRRSSTR